MALHEKLNKKLDVVETHIYAAIEEMAGCPTCVDEPLRKALENIFDARGLIPGDGKQFLTPIPGEQKLGSVERT